MFARVGIHACNGQTLRLSAKNTSFKPSTFATFQPPVSQHRSVTSLATRFSQSSSRSKQPSHSLLLFVAGGTSLFAYTIDSKPLRCEPSNQSARPYAEPHTVSVQGPGSARLTRSREAQVVESSVDLKSLSFGAVAGISTGIFIKKGLKAAGFLLGGVFVLLQYLASRGMLNVDWKTMATRYDSIVDSYAGTGAGSKLARVGSRVVDFLLADFPPRATFTAGLVLGLRIG
ncbi:hypothetical protein P389DRAFT_171032 [Cystobasidium minutum MCA 4210]|uniref:uncharacterized protein n=1 Tax=Cystobasidium minutum MCA 4210 TaxID=1397322 RepID=UPI0034CDDDC7|eukprot:jgi/Rhomi1/171032/fgenesh1_kg.4_\